ncbi:MAG TPA: hypothetical protein VMI13_08400 [Solirubrobacteraceae bacterium]|nr:hypothetical protein [Solirubrobacteraceae bacterium]
MTLALEWDRAKFHSMDEGTERVEVPFQPEQLAEATRQALAAALVNLEVIGGPIEDAKLSHDHIRLEITRDADLDGVKRQVQELVDGVVGRFDEAPG